jgi:hypothetical protein
VQVPSIDWAFSLIGRVLPLQVQGRGTSEQIIVEIVHRG